MEKDKTSEIHWLRHCNKTRIRTVTAYTADRRQSITIACDAVASDSSKGRRRRDAAPPPIGLKICKNKSLFPYKTRAVHNVHLRQMTMALIRCLADPSPAVAYKQNRPRQSPRPVAKEKLGRRHAHRGQEAELAYTVLN